MRSRPPGRLPPFVPCATLVQRLPAASPVHMLVSVRRSHPLLRPPLVSPRRRGCSVGGSLVAAAPDTPPVGPPAPPGGVGPLGGLRAVRRPRARSVAVGTRRPPRPVLLSSRRRARSAGVSSAAVLSSQRASACTDGYPRTPREFFSGRDARPRPSVRSGGGVRLVRCSLARGVVRSRPAIRAPPRPSVPVRVPGRISPDPERILRGQAHGRRASFDADNTTAAPDSRPSRK